MENVELRFDRAILLNNYFNLREKRASPAPSSSISDWRDAYLFAGKLIEADMPLWDFIVDPMSAE
jgi:hypothetical protein